MSTKLTAKRRYLPRIKEGAEQFNAMISKNDAELIKAFVADELPPLKRAMTLYGT